VSTPSTTIPRTPTGAEDLPAGNGLALLLDLFALESGAQPAPRAADRPRPGARARLQDWVRRAALWGAGPQGAWRAW
jgi:hypothetical protein